MVAKKLLLEKTLINQKLIFNSHIKTMSEASQNLCPFLTGISKYKEYTIHQRNLQTLMIEIYEVINNIAPSVTNSLSLSFLFVKMYIISEAFRLYQTAQRKQQDMVSRQCHIDHFPYRQIYYKITNVKLFYMPSKQKWESGMLKFLCIGSVSITKRTKVLFECY